LPLLRQINPNVVENLTRLGGLCAAEGAVVAAWAGGQLGGAVRDGALDLDALRAQPAALHGHLVRAWLAQAGLPSPGLTARHVRLVLQLAHGSAASGRVVLKGARVVRRRYERLQLDAPPAAVPSQPRALRPGETVTLPGGWRIRALEARERTPDDPLPADLWAAVCDADRMEQPLQIRLPRVGERLAPLGLDGTRKLSDVFTDRRVPASERWAYPVIAYGDAIVWVPGVVRSQVLQVRGDTRRVLSLQARRHQDDVV
jgi:tRNA(Ile)-lysidine synthase